MSRLIVKNLPNKVTVEKLRDVFGEKGEVTDVQLKYTKDGKFRNFGFIGYRTEEQATHARDYFDGTCINSMQIQVQTCANLGDEKKPKAWSKYAPDSTAYKKLHKDEIEDKKKSEKKEKKIEKNKNKIKELLRKHKDDPLFAEFIEAHVNDKTTWIKEALESASKSDDDEEEIKEDHNKNHEKADTPIENVQKTDTENIDKVKDKKVANKPISDLEYMKLLMKKVGDPPSENKTEDKSETIQEEQQPKKIRNRPLFHVKIMGLPYKCKKKDIKEFFRPLVPFSIRLPYGKGKKVTGFCYVGFRTEKELKKALGKDKLFLGNHRIHIHKYEDKSKSAAEEEEETNKKRREETSQNEESIGESGSIFVRNLAYVVSEEEITSLFEKYGPLAEVNMPIDPISRQPKGFATVTFVIPEHAVKAYTELDGTAFCGRMLHLLPAKTQKLENDEDDEGLSFKEKKAKKLKAQAKSFHNWNVLFLGTNAVADVIASTYNTTKEQLLNDNNKSNHRIHIHKYEDKSKSAAEEEEETNKKRREETSQNEESIGESGSIFVRNLAYVVSEEEITSLFEKYGPLAEVNMPIDPISRQPKGFATVTFVIPEHAVKAYTELDGTAFCGRMLHLLPAKTQKLENDEDDEGLSFKEKKAKKLKAQAKSFHNWNVLFLGTNAVADVIASTYNTTKEQLLNDNNKNTSAAVRLALGETQLVAETKTFLESNGVYLDAFNKTANKRSKTCILVKNLPADTDKDEIKALFVKHGQIARFLMPQHGITALVDFIEPFEAKKAFTKLAYSQFKSAPLYLEWAPENVFIKSAEKTEPSKITIEKEPDESNNKIIEKPKAPVVTREPEDSKAELKVDDIDDPEEPENDTTLFVKNLHFKTTEDSLKAHFSAAGKVHSVSIAKKKDSKNPGQFLSMGYGFVQYYKREHANEALKNLQVTTLDGKSLELKRSERGNTNEVRTSKKTNKDTTQNGTKILVRNVPFQANRKELHEIFRAFGEIKTLRLPKKLSPGTDQHRGFAFVDFYSKADAKSAFGALCQSTHLYGRRLVLEWAEQGDDTEDISTLRKRTAQSFNAQTPGGKKSRKGAVDVEKFVEGENNAM